MPDTPKGIIDFAVLNLSVPNVPTELTTVDRNYEDFIPFGSDNLFPQALIELARNSSVHRGIINNKQIYVEGDGIVSDDPATQKYLEAVNPQENLDEMAANVELDYIFFGNAYIEVVTDAKRSFVNLFHKDGSKCRVSKDKKFILHHPDWSQYAATKPSTTKYPVWPEFGKVEGNKFLRSIYHLKQYEPGSEIYGIPSYIAGMNAAGIIYKTDKWNISRLDNSFKPSGILVVTGVQSTEDAIKFKQEFNDSFTGEGATGKIMAVFKTLGGEETTFTAFDSTFDGDWTQLHTQSESNIITAHSWFRSLSGIADNTGFDTQRIRNEYEVAMSTTIRKLQKFFVKKLNRLLRKELGLNAKLYFKNSPPISIAGLLDVNAITKIFEGRKLLGLPYDETDVEQNKYIKSGGNTINISK